jgi:hypothetical protein
MLLPEGSEGVYRCAILLTAALPTFTQDDGAVREIHPEDWATFFYEARFRAPLSKAPAGEITPYQHHNILCFHDTLLVFPKRCLTTEYTFCGGPFVEVWK